MPPDIRANPFRPVYSGPRFHHLPPRPPIPDGHRNKIIPSSPSDKPEPRATSRSSGDQPEPRIKKDATAIHPSNPDSPCATDCHTSTKSANDKALGTTTDDYHIQTQESTVIQDSPTLPMSDPTPAADSNDDIRRKITQALRRLRKHHARQEAQVQAFKRASRRTKEGIEEYHRWQFEQAQRVGADVTDGMDLEEATVPQPANCPTKSQEPQNNKDMDCEQARESQPVDNYTREVKGSEQASKSQRTNNYTRDVNDHAESQEASMDAEDPLNAKQNSEAEQYSLRDRPLPATTHSAEDGLQDGYSSESDESTYSSDGSSYEPSIVSMDQDDSPSADIEDSRPPNASGSDDSVCSGVRRNLHLDSHDPPSAPSENLSRRKHLNAAVETLLNVEKSYRCRIRAVYENSTVTERLQFIAWLNLMAVYNIVPAAMGHATTPATTPDAMTSDARTSDVTFSDAMVPVALSLDAMTRVPTRRVPLSKVPRSLRPPPTKRKMFWLQEEVDYLKKLYLDGHSKRTAVRMFCDKYPRRSLRGVEGYWEKHSHNWTLE